MTIEQRKALTIALKTYLDCSEDYVSDMWDNDIISEGLKILFNENVLTAKELSKEIKDFVGVNVSPLMLRYAADGIFIDVTKGGKSNE